MFWRGADCNELASSVVTDTWEMCIVILGEGYLAA